MGVVSVLMCLRKKRKMCGKQTQKIQSEKKRKGVRRKNKIQKQRRCMREMVEAWFRMKKIGQNDEIIPEF